MSIGFDVVNGISGTWLTGVTGVSGGKVVTGANPFLAMGNALYNSGSITVSGITYNGVALAQANQITATLEAANQTTDIWWLDNPATGSNTLTATLSGTAGFYAFWHGSWTGKTTTGLEGNNATQNTSSSTTSPACNITITHTDCWIIGFAFSRDASSPTAGSGTTIRGASVVGHALGDSNADVGTGNQTLNFVAGSATWPGVCSLAISAANAGGSGSTGTLAKTNANDTSAASGTTTILGTLAKTNANDTSVASGTTTVTGTLAKTNANDTVVASGSTGQATGTVAYTNANDTSVAAGTTTVIGTLSKTNANDSVVASGVAGIVSGTLAYTNNNDTVVASGSTPSSSVFGRDGLGGDDVPYRKSPHKGWDKAEWKRRKQFEDGLESTLRETYQRLMGIPAVAAKVDVIVKPVIVNDEPKIDWTKLAQSYARSNALIKLDQEEADLRAAIDEEDEFLMAMI